MKVIILAGGWGSRLGQLTEVVPKPMVHIGNMPVLWHIMNIYSYYGFNEFIIALGVKGEVIKNYFTNYKVLNSNITVDFSSDQIIYHDKKNERDWKVTLVNTGLNTLKGARIKKLEKYLVDDTNLLTYGDGVADINLKELISFHKTHNKTITVSGVRPPSAFGEFEEIDGRITSFVEKPKSARSYINGGFMVFNKNLLSFLSEDEDNDFEFGVLEELALNGEVMVYKHDGSWECMDHERDVLYLNKLWNSGKAFWKVW